MNQRRYTLKIYSLKVGEAPLPQDATISSPAQAKAYLRPYFLKMRDDRERFIAVPLTAQNRPLGIAPVGEGGASMVWVDPKVLFRTLLVTGCVAFILAHNHPSGHTEPSSHDLNLTKRIKDGGELLGLECLDHLIFGDGTNAVLSLQEDEYIFTNEGKNTTISRRRKELYL